MQIDVGCPCSSIFIYLRNLRWSSAVTALVWSLNWLTTVTLVRTTSTLETGEKSTHNSGDATIVNRAIFRILVDPISRFTQEEDPEPEITMKMIGDTKWGGYAEYVVIWDRQLLHLPDSVGFEEASCLPIAFGSAYRMMMVHAQVQEGEKVLVLGATGGVGNCAVQLAKSAGAIVVACGGSEEKCKKLVEHFDVDGTINTAKDDIVKYTRKFTGGSLFSGGGFDVVVNSQGGTETENWWTQGLKCAKMGGRVTLLGATAGYAPPTDLRYVWTGELKILGSNSWEKDDLQSLVDLLESGKLKPVIGASFPLEKAIEAHFALENRKYFGKIVVTGNAPVFGVPSKANL